MATYHLIRLVFGWKKAPELVAIVADVEMAFAWCGRAPAGEYRRCVRSDFAP